MKDSLRAYLPFYSKYLNILDLYNVSIVLDMRLIVLADLIGMHMPLAPPCLFKGHCHFVASENNVRVIRMLSNIQKTKTYCCNVVINALTVSDFVNLRITQEEFKLLEPLMASILTCNGCYVDFQEFNALRTIISHMPYKHLHVDILNLGEIIPAYRYPEFKDIYMAKRFKFILSNAPYVTTLITYCIVCAIACLFGYDMLHYLVYMIIYNKLIMRSSFSHEHDIIAYDRDHGIFDVLHILIRLVQISRIAVDKYYIHLLILYAATKILTQ